MRSAHMAPHMGCLAALTASLLLLAQPQAQDLPKTEPYRHVDDVRPGLKGYGKTVIKGAKIETFDAEVIGVLRNTSPGRDLILCRLAGLNLDRTGVIAGMSGSPIYIGGKLLGAVAYAWPYGKEPIAGVTPFVQMREFVTAHERRELADKARPRRIGLAAPVRVEGQTYDTVTVAANFGDAPPAAADGLTLVPLRTPLAASGFSARSLGALKARWAGIGMVPMQGGSAGAANIPEEERNVTIQPGGALSIGLITGDFDLSGIGTVTHVEGKRVYGWGHPFHGLGGCDLPLMTGYVHTIFPRMTLSFKMGSPLRTVGAINADVSTCVAGWLDRQPDMLPVSTTVTHAPAGEARTYNVKVVRHPALAASLVHTALANSLDAEGDLPEELTAHLKVRIEVEGREPLVLHDVFSGPAVAGGKGPQNLFAPVGTLLQQLTTNTLADLRIKGVESSAEIQPGRRTAEIEATELESDVVAPGEMLRATVTLRPYRGPRQRVSLALELPPDLPEGPYTAMIGDDVNNARMDLRDNPQLNYPQTVDHLYQSVQSVLAAKRTNLVLRVPIDAGGVAMGGKTLPDLPAGMVQVLSSGRRTGTQTIYRALVTRHATDWVLHGGETLRFQVARHRQTARN